MPVKKQLFSIIVRLCLIVKFYKTLNCLSLHPYMITSHDTYIICDICHTICYCSIICQVLLHVYEKGSHLDSPVNLQYNAGDTFTFQSLRHSATFGKIIRLRT